MNYNIYDADYSNIFTLDTYYDDYEEDFGIDLDKEDDKLETFDWLEEITDDTPCEFGEF